MINSENSKNTTESTNTNIFKIVMNHRKQKHYYIEFQSLTLKCIYFVANKLMSI